MAALKNIPVKVENAGTDGSIIGGGLVAILHEIAEMLDRLIEFDESGAIDLRSLPFSPTDYRQLQEILGRGEVEITLNSDGKSYLRETAYPGVWWVEHRDLDNQQTAELLEIAAIPAIVVTDAEDIIQASRRLKERLSIHTAGRSAS